MNPISRRDFNRSLLLSSLALTLPRSLYASATTAPASQPNIIFILSDDVGLGDLGCTGGQYKTPHIDDLAKNGTRFEFCYANPLCGPSRCECLTGRYPFRTGLVSNNSRNAIAPSREIMMPSILKPAGYTTASVGKWGQMCLGPGEWGFDEYLVFPGSGRYWRDQTTFYTQNGQRKNLPEGQYLPDLMHTFLIDFITRHQANPFYVYYPMSHIHGPIVRTPDSPAGQKNFYADNITYMDKLVGMLVAELDRLKLREKTLLVFTGDNGTAGGPDKSPVNGKPLAGAKASMLEGGSRVPLIANWPLTTPAGIVNHDLTDFSDFFPTFAELAGAKPPEKITIDGHSFAPQLKGLPGTPREWIYVELSGRRYIRNTRYKLTGSGNLFDMKEAPFKEIPVPADSADPEALAAKVALQTALTNLVGLDLLKNPPPDTPPRRRRRRPPPPPPN